MLTLQVAGVGNPPDCAAARYLLCDLRYTCGFACQLHHAASCLGAAYHTRRTLVLRTKGYWR